MPSPNFLTITEQAAAYLREELMRGRWRGRMPGMNQLAPELGINAKTAEAALQLLEKQKLLLPQGQGRPRLIMLPENRPPIGMRVTILPYDKAVTKIDYIIDIRHQLQQAGHLVDFASNNLLQLGTDSKRIAQFVKKSEADAWVVVAGSRAVMEWFEAQTIPTFALFGRARELPLPFAGPRKGPALIKAVNRLVSLGHRRIVLLTREERRKPFPGALERTFIAALEAHGLPVGSYNLPDWQDSMPSFHGCLKELFRHTPPTAMIISEPSVYFATQQHIAQSGLVAPRDISMICLDYDPVFAWCEPPIAHIHWDSQSVVRRVARWANNIARGKDDRRKTWIKADFVEGGSIGPAPKGR